MFAISNDIASHTTTAGASHLTTTAGEPPLTTTAVHLSMEYFINCRWQHISYWYSQMFCSITYNSYNLCSKLLMTTPIHTSCSSSNCKGFSSQHTFRIEVTTEQYCKIQLQKHQQFQNYIVLVGQYNICILQLQLDVVLLQLLLEVMLHYHLIQ